MDIIFEYPAFLWLLAALVPFAVWDGVRRWGASRVRQLASVTVRLLLLAAIALALARPQVAHDDEVADVVFLVDRSASVPDSLLEYALQRVESLRAGLSDDERAALVLFDESPEVVVYPGQEWVIPEHVRGEAVAETNLGMALQVGLGLIPQDHAGRIVLVSDARPTQGAAAAALTTAREREVSVWSVPLEPGFSDPAVYDVEWASEQFGPGETISGAVVLRGGPEPVQGTLRLTLGAETVAEESVSLPANDTLRVPFEYAPEEALEPGLAVLRAELELADASADPRLVNNAMASGIDITGPPQVLIVASNLDDVTNLAQAFEAEEMEATVFETRAFVESGAEFGDYDLVVLANVPAESPSDRAEPLPVLPPEHLATLRRYVSDGGGLVVFGGDASYELGGYGQSELAGALPIELRPRDPEVDPAVTMMMILDNSGSMGTWAEGGTKMDLANQGAAAAMHLLRDFDRIGVMAVDDRVDWVVRLQEASNKEALERAIRGIPVGGGGIYVYTALREAYRAIRTSDTPLRHVILFTDAADSEEQVAGIIFGWGAGPNSYDLARSMRAEGITVSVIAIGSEWDQDTSFCRNLADAGGGRFYITDRASQLESLFVEETQRLVDSVLNENPFRVRSEGEHDILAGLDFRRSPRLRGLMQLEARPTADVLLTHPDGYPVLTTWQYGLGQVAAFAIDAGPRWADRWLDWEGYPILYSQLARWALRRHEGDETAIEIAHGDTQSVMTLARRSPEGLSEVSGGMRAELVDITENATDVGGQGAPIALQVLEPGLWQASLSTEPGHRYRVVIRDGEGETFAEETFVAPGAAEFRYEEADRAWLEGLAEVTGGAVDPRPGEVAGPTAVVTTRTATWSWWLLGAILLMPIDAFLRRPARDA